ncbi:MULTISPECIES: D-amino acid dehydrogenase [Bradyrhizobium]|uniref:D-amino acid dehydrogenase n=1 Tax=Bradyrhizobium TaxID=374 RepID=UPI0004AEA83B|nr:D-amino acid dehydrogenase [Bradyrhizobium yuanmingense]MCA1364429.1 D-amino acid dehydrogenase [Bradyrhizobium sp. IC4059]MCA1392911.1 D-amino acid dehydrogenase [Bradyrhizobium sp. IC3123]MCA1479188.1 D-amino acid dehydrogenase [Bradyrhizobium sp. NBAIM08]MCA1498677.1 D-amino acid dehydrogenase [Bradyrhizobium sp. NBAIM14]MCA1521415.1 D-amino acid dehydrogenase [Bradyrhizobium sp. IC3069]MCA1536485.1 D-amino acid dehydrogenase [Bradyrhizobium sp. NBAIM03]
MKVLILGSGVIGVTSAYYLARAGHEVTVVDRQPEPALETSFANAGEVSPGYSSPWAGPGVPVKAIKWLLMKHGPLVIRPKLDPVMWVWLLKMLRNCTSARYAVNKSRMIPIAEYSRDALRDLRRDIGIQYDERSQGTLQLFRYQAQLDGTAEDIAVLKQYGVPFEVLNREGCIAVEPALAGVKEKFVGGLRLPQDETGDCHMFTQALARHAQALGVRFLFNTSIDRIVTDGARVSGVATSAGLLQADAYVLALGSWSSRLLAPLGISLPVYPVKGYSITVPIKDASGAPESTVMDESYKVAITRLGNRIRVGGTAEISGYSDKLYDARRATLDHSLTDLFPRGGDLSKATFWSGLRPMTPDGPPVIGRTHYANLHLNTGHGTLGWTMSCGSGRVLADMLSGKKPDIDVSALSVERYKHRFG